MCRLHKFICFFQHNNLSDAKEEEKADDSDHHSLHSNDLHSDEENVDFDDDNKSSDEQEYNTRGPYRQSPHSYYVHNRYNPLVSYL